MKKRNRIISFKALFGSKRMALIPVFLLIFSQLLLAQSGKNISGKVVSQVDGKNGKNDPLKTAKSVTFVTF
ncbi:hypothetical protein [Prevotella sp. 10(H)]|uniref:hypothetical protein n=1 Tax=Prevotella sp. 10(H) TaxID=1158294 RepID=UPI0004A6F7A6|nr:hypothetical protein [Prevotella sp. 10(H)]